MKGKMISLVLITGFIIFCPLMGVGQTITAVTTLAGTGHPELSSAVRAEILLAEVVKNELPAIRATLKVMPENSGQSKVLSVVYNSGKNLTADLYYPADMDFEKPRPVVVFLNGFRDRQAPGNLKSIKDLGNYISWGAALAARGLVAVSYAVASPQEDLDTLMAFLQANAEMLGIDFSSLGIFVCSANGVVVFQNLMNPAKPYHDSIHAMLVLYAKTQPWGGFVPPAIPYMLIQAGRDDPKINSQMEALAAAIRDAGGDLVFETHETGIHSFDLYLDDPRTKELIQASQDFLVKKLTD